MNFNKKSKFLKIYLKYYVYKIAKFIIDFYTNLFMINTNAV
jgi:hypothetical protein